MGLLDDFSSFLTDPAIKNNAKIGRWMLVVIMALLLNNITGFTYYYNMNSKLLLVKELGKMQVNSEDAQFVAELKNLEMEILHHQNIFESTYYSRFTKGVNDKVNSEVNSPRLQNGFLFHLTAGGLFYITALLVLPLILILVKDQTVTQKLSFSALLVVVFFLIGFLFSYLCGLIPALWNGNSWVNYCLNALIQGSTFFLLSMSGKQNREKKRSETKA